MSRHPCRAPLYRAAWALIVYSGLCLGIGLLIGWYSASTYHTAPRRVLAVVCGEGR